VDGVLRRILELIPEGNKRRPEIITLFIHLFIYFICLLFFSLIDDSVSSIE
jgi:hypothetical protein